MALSRLTQLLCAASISLGSAVTVQGQTVAEVNTRLDTLFGSHEPYQTFFAALQQAVAADDQQAVAVVVAYPLRTRINGQAVTIQDARHFVARYDGLVTAKVRRAIVEQSAAQLSVSWRGVSIGDGELWFSGIGKTGVVRIIAINN